MPFIPHTEADIGEMLAAIGVDSIEALFDEIPAELRSDSRLVDEPGMHEAEVIRLMRSRAERIGGYRSFIGAGAYEHHVPAAVWEIVTRGEFYSSYTPYQAEASQGTLQVLYEYQSMMTALTALDVTNASLYDGASALAEAVLMSVRLHKSSRRVLVPRTVPPAYRATVRTLVRNQGIELIELDYDAERGHVDPQLLDRFGAMDIAALVIPQPNFFGVLEPVDVLTDWAHAHGALAIGVVNPLAAALLKPPGEWGRKGADIAVGDGQPLGIPLSAGGPYYGFMACRKEHLRQMPGRIVGRTVDSTGRPGFTLTLQAREQHIRRSKATSNICTNQGLMVTASTIHMALLGAEGLRRTAAACHVGLTMLLGNLSAIPGLRRAFSGPVFHEAVLELDAPVEDVLRALRAQGILGGLDLARAYPELRSGLLVCVTETKNECDLMEFAAQLASIMGERCTAAPCAFGPGA
ncbi:MAG: aminomethyl-transferring glycine dehydrogenase subunit GcvPA [Betaproteobacteria bacterium]|nr:MAG: aminomethyl-transferring glycine dehydrogenase subunit GcvPA [Betaproteobacteria bacterium]